MLRLGKGQAHGRRPAGRRSAGLLPVPRGAPGPPEGSTTIPSWLLGVSSALTTLSSELLTLGIYRNQAQKRHLEAHKY